MKTLLIKNISQLVSCDDADTALRKRYGADHLVAQQNRS